MTVRFTMAGVTSFRRGFRMCLALAAPMTVRTMSLLWTVCERKLLRMRESFDQCSISSGYRVSLKAAVDMGACRSGITTDNGAPFPGNISGFRPPSTGFQNLPEGLTAPSDLGALCELSGPSQYYAW